MSCEIGVSINQIGLAIWGWIFLGLLIGFTSNKVKVANQVAVRKKNLPPAELSPGNFITMVTSFILGVLFVIPIARGEIAWKQSLKNDKPEQVILKTDSWPRSNQRFTQTINLFLKSNMPSEALMLARLNSKFDSNNYNAWFYIYNISANNSEKNEAKNRLRTIDPLNTSYKA